MELPQTLTIKFKPVDDGSVATMEVEAEHEVSYEEIDELLRWASQAFTESLMREKLMDMRNMN